METTTIAKVHKVEANSQHVILEFATDQLINSHDHCPKCDY